MTSLLPLSVGYDRPQRLSPAALEATDRMDHDERERRDWPQDDEATRPSGEPADTTVTPEEQPAGEPPATEIESWPSQDVSPAAEPAWPTEPPPAGSGSVESWPTEAPRAGSGTFDEGRWPTEPPERGDEQADAWRSDASRPPSEVEAYPTAASAETPAEPVAATAPMAAQPVPAAESAAGESTQCPRCGTENRPGLAFCRNCGQRLVAAGVSTTVERPGTPEGTMACPRCGTHNRAGVAFCQNCGANLRGTAPGYVPPAVAVDEEAEVTTERRGAVLGPVVLLVGLVGLITAYLLPFAYGSGSLFDRSYGGDGYGVAFWNGYPEVGAALADQAYFGFAAASPILAVVLLVLAIAGFVRARPGPLQTVGLVIALLWSVGLIVLFLVVEVFGNLGGDLVGMLRLLTPAGIIFFLASLIVLIGTLTRFARS